MINKNLVFYLFNWFSFYVYWVICIWGAGNNDYFWGPLIGSLFIILHIVFIKDRFKEIKYILICILSGFIIQSLFYYLGILQYNGSFLIGNIIFIPIWLLVLWAGFGTTIYHSFKWLLKRKLMGGILGAIFFPVIYYSSYKWGAILFTQNFQNYFVVSMLSAVNFYILISIAVRMDEND